MLRAIKTPRGNKEEHTVYHVEKVDGKWVKTSQFEVSLYTESAPDLCCLVAQAVNAVKLPCLIEKDGVLEEI